MYACACTLSQTHTHTHTHASHAPQLRSYNYFVCSWPSTYPMIIHTHPVAGNLPIKTVVARGLQITYTHSHMHTRTHTHTQESNLESAEYDAMIAFSAQSAAYLPKLGMLPQALFFDYVSSHLYFYNSTPSPLPPYHSFLWLYVELTSFFDSPFTEFQDLFERQCYYQRYEWFEVSHNTMMLLYYMYLVHMVSMCLCIVCCTLYFKLLNACWLYGSTVCGLLQLNVSKHMLH